MVERYEYGPFGAPTILDPSGAVREESAIGNAYLWNGREYDAETCLYYYRLRYLDPELGRFTTLDPIGLWGDPNNLGNGYAYVGNRPWTGLDPFGLYGANAWHNAYLAERMQHGGGNPCRSILAACSRNSSRRWWKHRCWRYARGANGRGSGRGR